MIKGISKGIPRILSWFLKKLCVIGMKEGYTGDLEEEFKQMATRKGRKKAVVWIWLHTVFSIPKALLITLVWGGIMFRNYLKTAFRNLKRERGFSFIHITGLVIGMTACLLIIQYVAFE